MYRFIHHNTTASIKNLVDVYTFRTEELVLNLSDLEVLVPDFVTPMLPAPHHGAGIYCGDDIKARLTLSNRDTFFLKTPEGMVPVEAQNLKTLQGVYLGGQLTKAYHPGLKFTGLEYFFGPRIGLSMTVKAQRKLLAARTIELLLQQQELHALSSELSIPSLKNLYPPADVDAWRVHMLTHTQQIQRPQTNQSFYNSQSPQHWEALEAYLPDENGFYFKLIDLLGVHMKKVFREIDLFLNDFRDCLYSLELVGEKLSIVRGIDHKYIPYYEQKFKHADEE